MKNDTAFKFAAAAIAAGVILSFATPGRAAETVRSATVTDDSGQTALSSIDRKWDQKTGTGTLNEAAITPDGKIATREANLTRNPDGTITATGTFTDFTGLTVNFTETTNPADASRATHGKMVGPDGAVATYEAAESRTGRNQIKRTTVITKADGTKETRVEIMAPVTRVASSL